MTYDSVKTINPITQLAILSVVIVLCMAIGGCSNQPSEEILFDFESNDELDGFAWRCHTLFSLSDDYATHGKRALKLELFPSDLTGIAPVDISKDWSGCRTFCFDVYNVQDHAVVLDIRIDDRDDSPDYQDRYNHKLRVKPGPNTVCLSCDSLVTSGTKRKMNMKRIFLVDIFMTNLEEKVVLYFDYFRLIR